MPKFRVRTPDGVFNITTDQGHLTPELALQLINQRGPEPEEEPEGPGLLRRGAAFGARVGLPIAGFVGGTIATANPLGGIAGGIAAGGVGEALAEKIEGEELDPRKIAANAVISGIPAGPAARAAVTGAKTVGRRVVLGALEGAGQGALSTAVQTGIEEGRLPTATEAAVGTGAGAGLGALFGRLLRPAYGGVADDVDRQAKFKFAGEAAEDAPIPPHGKRQIVLPDEPSPVPAPEGAEQLRLFTKDGHVTAEAANSVLVERAGVPFYDKLRDDFTASATATVDALGKLPKDVQKQRLFKQLNAAVQGGLFDPAETTVFLRRHGLSMAEFMDREFMRSTTEAGQSLQRLSAIKKKMIAVASQDPDARRVLDMLATAKKEDDGAFTRFWQEIVDLDDVSRATVIGQMATATRNGWTQAARTLLDIPVEGFILGMQKVGLRPVVNGRKGNPLATLWGLSKAARRGNTDEVLDLLEKLGPKGELSARELFGSGLSESPFTQTITGGLVKTARRGPLQGVRARVFDQPRTGQAFRGLPRRMKETIVKGVQEGRVVKTVLGPVADAATAMNQVQENFFRRAVFQAKLAARTEARGAKWGDVVKNPAKHLTDDDVDFAIRESLEATFAAEPTSKGGKKFLQIMRSAQPISTQLLTFPRYFTNYGKFIMDFNPAGAVKLFGGAPRKGRRAASELAAREAGKATAENPFLDAFRDATKKDLQQFVGEGLDSGTRSIARATVGTAMLGAAWGWRESKFAGEKWFEIAPHGRENEKRVNIVGLFGPFLPFAYMGEVMAQLDGGRERRPLEVKDAIQGAAGLRLTPGVKAFMQAAARSEGFYEAAVTAAGETLGRFTVPLRSIKDFHSAYGDVAGVESQEDLYYDPRQVLELGKRRTRLLNPTIQNIPGLGAKLDRPASVSVFTGEELKSEAPVLRQVGGATQRSATRFQIEAERLGFDSFDFIPGKGLPNTDAKPKIQRELTRRVGAMAKVVGEKLIDSPEYQKLPRTLKRKFFKRIFQRLAKKAREHLEETNPELAAAAKLSRKFNRDDKEFLQEELGVDINEEVFKLGKAAPGR